MLAPPFESVVETRGRTPVVALQRLEASAAGKARAWIGVKLESFNPTGAAQDRLAAALVEEGIASGALPPGGRVVEASGGNLAVSLAMVCAARGFQLTAVMPESVSPERQALVRAYGAALELTPDEAHLAGAIARAEAIGAEHPGAYLPRQFRNPVTVRAYEETLGEELAATAAADGGADALVGTVGSGGQLIGAARAMRRRFPQLRVIAAVPDVGEGRPHHLQGVGVGVPLPLLEGARADGLRIDRAVSVRPGDAVAMQRRLAREEGILAGYSTGLAVRAALEVAAELGEGRRLYVIGSDSGERYFSLQGYFP